MGQLYALLCLGMPYSGDISNNYDHIHHALLDGATGDHVVPRVRYLAEDGESVPWQQVQLGMPQLRAGDKLGNPSVVTRQVLTRTRTRTQSINLNFPGTPP